ncbi:MAG TPA: polyhydroxyalkanoate synthesis repressor PhaR [Alphaproteobacteria bacterium]|jgi:polyhydroxyalkanoate synthesis repressor PhaR|nr:polyhydroxyalkanoate synthesis repressor PhaR [Alphaproteobacteria bacterium]
MAETTAGDESPITIKKYANRRLYNTATSSYVTLDHLSQMVKDGKDFVVYDAKSGEDITRSVLTQIIFEEEAKGQNLLPISFLRKLITFYGDNLQAMLPRYLEMSMEMFSRNQEQMRDYMSQAFGDSALFRQMEEVGRQNMAMFQQAMSMFAPFTGQQPPKAPNGSGHAGKAEPAPKPEAAGDDLARLRQQLQDMQRKLDQLAGKDEG